MAARNGAEEAEVGQGPDEDGTVGCRGREEWGVGMWEGLPGTGYGGGGEGG